MITSLTVNNFTAIAKAKIELSSGLNVLLGKNSTGKSHLLKLMYALCAAKSTPAILKEDNLSDLLTSKLFGVFKPEKKIGRLCREGRQKSEVRASFIDGMSVSFAFSSDMKEVVVIKEDRFSDYKLIPVFLPPREMLSSFPGFSSLYLQREISTDETYFDLCLALETPLLRGNANQIQTAVLEKLESACGGEFVLMKQKQFYYKPKEGGCLRLIWQPKAFESLVCFRDLCKMAG